MSHDTEKNKPLKQTLRESSDRHRAAFEEGLDEWVDNVGSLGKNTLLIGGGIILGYQVFKLLLPREGNVSKGSPTNEVPSALPATGLTTLVKSKPTTRLGHLKIQLIEEAKMLLLREIRKYLEAYLEDTKNGKQ